MAAAVAVVVATAYGLHLRGAFVWDDQVYLLNNPRLAVGASFWTAVKTPLDGQVFRPVSTAALWLGVQLHGFSMAWFRAVHLAMHLACGAALFAWLRRHLGSSAGALIGASLFLAHPAATEAVMFANARHDLLGTLCALCALVALGDGGSARRGALAGLFTMLAIGCKESFIVLPAMLAAQSLASGRREQMRARLGWTLAPALLAGVVVFSVRHALGVSTRSALGQGLWTLARAFAGLIAHHGAAFVTLTEPPTAQRYVPPSTAATLVVLSASAGAWVALAWGVYRQRNVRAAWVGATVFFLALLPTIAAIPSTGQHANRYGYFALAGFAMLVASASVPLLARLKDRTSLVRGLAFAAALVVLAACAVETSARAAEWRDGMSLFGADVARIPDDSRANYHYGVEVVSARGCAAALPYFARAASAEPTWARPFRNLAGCNVRLGRIDAALGPALRAVQLDPSEAAHRRNLATVLLAKGQLDAARAQLAMAERLAPGAPQNAAIAQMFPR